jgi:hypothetical protein
MNYTDFNVVIHSHTHTHTYKLTLSLSQVYKLHMSNTIQHTPHSTRWYFPVWTRSLRSMRRAQMRRAATTTWSTNVWAELMIALHMRPVLIPLEGLFISRPCDIISYFWYLCIKVTTTRMCSFTCSCQPGFIGSGTVCSDMNECLQGSTMCGLEAFCRNTFGSYDCVCQMGFYLNLGACVSCPTGTSTDFVGALSSVACTMCDAGENNRPASWLVLHNTLLS